MIEITTLSELTIDGKLSLGPNTSSKDLFSFYGEELGRWFHGLRAQSDAIMVGSNTVRNDDPELTVRHVKGPNPLRIIPASEGRLPLDARLLNDGLPTLVVVSRRASPAAVAALAAKSQVEVICCGENLVCLRELVSVLRSRGIRSLIVEGGSRLLHSLFQAELVSRVIIKHIPIIAGSIEAPSYLRPSSEAMPLPLSRWRVAEWFVKGGVGVSIYRPLLDVA
jgi:5-amino-6-(5-phosphoribosylamino)uracil reductase/2,5-diamino-6-(ribosylamino)-4(3H)-pyrimidinone 5'-phosphate reductase